MGTRRLRDLCAIEGVALALFETRADRREQAHRRFGIETFAAWPTALEWAPDTLSISTPPDQHEPYIKTALQTGLNFFCEADIWTYDFQNIQQTTADSDSIAAPSCTLYFLPLVQELRRIVREELGTLAAYSMCLSVDAPNWHPSEREEYYARHRSTAPAREMVPFELIGLNSIFGPPSAVSGIVTRRGHLTMDSEDTWCLQIRTQTGAIGQLAVLMASPQTMRCGWAGGSNGFIQFDLISGEITRRLPALGIHDTRNFGRLGDVLEQVYAAEMAAFVRALRREAEWPFRYAEAALATATLAAAEKSGITQSQETIHPGQRPALLPDQYA